MNNKSDIPNQSDTSSTAEGSKKEGVSPYASLGDRMLAQVIDGLIALGAFFLVGMALAERFGGLTEKGFELTGFPALVLMGILVVIMLPYFILAEAFFGMTLGKLVAGIQVTSREGQRISMRASIIRNLMRLIDGFVLYLIGAFSVILTKQSQRLGDIIAGTIVTTRATGRALRACALVAALALGVGGAWGGFALRGSQQIGIAGGAPITATLARNVSADHEPIEPTTTFSPEIPMIHVAFKASQVQPDSRLKAVWTAVNVGAASPPNTQLAESTLVLPGSVPGTFRFRRGPQSWLVGDYKVDLYLNDQLVLTLPYKVAP